MITTASNIYIFEDTFKHYKMLSKCLRDLNYSNIYPTRENFEDFLINTQEYLNQQMTVEDFIVRNIDNNAPPNLFFVDIKLYDTESTTDYSGIQLRDELIQNHFPDSPVIFISQFNRLMEEKKQGKDGAIHKFFLGQLDSNIEKHLKDVLPKEIDRINNLPQQS